LGKKVNAYNGGVSANESKHSLNSLFNKVLPMKPDIVVMMHNYNDTTILNSQGSYDYRGSRKSHLQTSKNVFTQIEYPTSKHSHEDEKREAFGRNLKTFIAVSKIHNTVPVLMTQANRDISSSLYHQFTNIIKEAGLAEQALVIDLDKEIPKTTDYLYDTIHLTENGSLTAAQVITTALINRFKEYG